MSREQHKTKLEIEKESVLRSYLISCKSCIDNGVCVSPKQIRETGQHLISLAEELEGIEYFLDKGLRRS